MISQVCSLCSALIGAGAVRWVGKTVGVLTFTGSIGGLSRAASGFSSPRRYSCRQANTWLGFTSCRGATVATEAPRTCVSCTMAASLQGCVDVAAPFAAPVNRSCRSLLQSRGYEEIRHHSRDDASQFMEQEYPLWWRPPAGRRLWDADDSNETQAGWVTLSVHPWALIGVPVPHLVAFPQ